MHLLWCCAELDELAGGDGACSSCHAVQLGNAPISHSSTSEALVTGSQDVEGSADLFVECQNCGTAYSWSVLALGDGLCSQCFEQKQELACIATGNSQSSSSTCTFHPAALPLDGDIENQQLVVPSVTSIQNETVTEIKPLVSNQTTGGSWRARRRAKVS